MAAPSQPVPNRSSDYSWNHGTVEFWWTEMRACYGGSTRCHRIYVKNGSLYESDNLEDEYRNEIQEAFKAWLLKNVVE